MAVNIFERYGIKEVANVYFEALAAEEETGVKAGGSYLICQRLIHCQYLAVVFWVKMWYVFAETE